MKPPENQTSKMSSERHEPGIALPAPRLDKVWTVAEAKSRLSEVLRCATEEGPQQIGKQRPHVVVPLATWLAQANQAPRLGPWLVRNVPRGYDDLELPSRSDGDREIPFADSDWSDSGD